MPMKSVDDLAAAMAAAFRSDRWRCSSIFRFAASMNLGVGDLGVAAAAVLAAAAVAGRGSVFDSPPSGFLPTQCARRFFILRALSWPGQSSLTCSRRS